MVPSGTDGGGGDGGVLVAAGGVEVTAGALVPKVCVTCVVEVEVAIRVRDAADCVPGSADVTPLVVSLAAGLCVDVASVSPAPLLLVLVLVVVVDATSVVTAVDVADVGVATTRVEPLLLLLLLFFPSTAVSPAARSSPATAG
jgi:hypothetical protein